MLLIFIENKFEIDKYLSIQALVFLSPALPPNIKKTKEKNMQGARRMVNIHKFHIMTE